MKIQITAGVGTGPTELAAFDTALVKAKIANYNLIYLSSVIPRGSEIDNTGDVDTTGKWGDRLYLVVAQHRTQVPNEEAWAGIGWVQTESGEGLFVEHHGSSETQVKRDIEDSLKATIKNRPDKSFGKINMKVIGVASHHEPVCALVAAVYQSEPWHK